jgi:RHS repeat-associated protein
VRFVHDGWNLLAELNASSGNAPLRSYLWGQDLSGSMEGAGGIGGLLAVRDHAGGTYHFVGFDGNGNVTVLVNASDQSPSAQYEYSPFGELIRATGPLATTNPFRWSTKFWDEDSGLVYYGFRYYSPSFGRWINRDPIEEDDLLNLYLALRNNALTVFDALGMSTGTLVDHNSAMGIGSGMQGSGAGTSIGIRRALREVVDNFGEMQQFVAAAAEGDAEGMLEAGLEVAKNIFVKKLKFTKRGKGLEEHHSDPKVYGGLRDQEPTQLPGNVHSALHSALYAFMKTFGMNYKKGVPGRVIQERFGRDKVLTKLAQFYKGVASQHPDLARAAEDFFKQHPHLR